MGVKVAVLDGVCVGVWVEVEVGVRVLGWKFVSVTVGVKVVVGVGVMLAVGVGVIEAVRMMGVRLIVVDMGVTLPVEVGVGVGVMSRGFGAKDKKTSPAQ